MQFCSRLLIIVGLVAASACSEAGGGVSASESKADRPPFDGAAAFELLVRQVGFGPRIPGSDGHARQLVWMRQWLTERADTLEEQHFAYRTRAGAELRMVNLLARFRPEARDRILLIAHWDTRPTADHDPDAANRSLPVPGANDGASGTAVLLQLAEMFRNQAPPLGVDLLLVDGEDYGPGTEDMFLGARFFAANAGGYRPIYAILLDMVGDRDARFPVEGYSAEHAPEVVQRVWSVARELGYADVFPNTPGGYVNDDHVPLNQAGIRTINIIDFDYGPGNRYWHSVQDVPENTSAETLRIVGEVVAEVVYRGG